MGRLDHDPLARFQLTHRIPMVDVPVDGFHHLEGRLDRVAWVEPVQQWRESRARGTGQDLVHVIPLAANGGIRA